jgi:hypothetical protein
MRHHFIKNTTYFSHIDNKRDDKKDWVGGNDEKNEALQASP